MWATSCLHRYRHRSGLNVAPKWREIPEIYKNLSLLGGYVLFILFYNFLSLLGILKALEDLSIQRFAGSLAAVGYGQGLIDPHRLVADGADAKTKLGG